MRADHFQKCGSLDLRFIVTIKFLSIRQGIQCIFFILMWICLFSNPASAQSTDIVRVGFSSSILENVNRNDAMAALRVWAMSFAEEHNIELDTGTMILDGIAEIKRLISNKELEYVCVTVDEYVKVREMLDNETVALGVVSGSITEEYVLCVHKESGIEKINDLKGKNLLLLSSSRAKMANIWMDTLFLREGLGQGIKYLGNIESKSQANNVILPIFFGKADAGIVTRNGFDTMVELNPQINQKLKIIAVSEPIVPTVFCFTSNTDESVREKVSEGITQWHTSPAGKQCLTIFRTDRLEEHPIDILKKTLELIEEHEQLLNRAGRSENTTLVAED